MIKAICFDLDGMYFSPEGKKGFITSLVDLGIPEEDVKYVLDQSPEMLQFVLGKISEQMFWDFVRSYFQKDLSDKEFTQLWIKDYSIDEDVKGLVRAVRKFGIKTCICSNNNPSRVNALQNKFHFFEDFNVRIFSYEVGHVKPSPELPGTEIYEILIEKAGVKPDELVYADDNPARIKGADTLGIKTFVYENFDQFKASLNKLGITDL